MLPREAVKGELRQALKNWNESGPRTEIEETYRSYWSFFSREIPDFLRQAAEAYYREGRDPAEVAEELGIKPKSVADNASHALGRVSEMICSTLSQQRSKFANVEPHQIVTAICELCCKP